MHELAKVESRFRCPGPSNLCPRNHHPSRRFIDNMRLNVPVQSLPVDMYRFVRTNQLFPLANGGGGGGGVPQYLTAFMSDEFGLLARDRVGGDPYSICHLSTEMGRPIGLSFHTLLPWQADQALYRVRPEEAALLAEGIAVNDVFFTDLERFAHQSNENILKLVEGMLNGNLAMKTMIRPSKRAAGDPQATEFKAYACFKLPAGTQLPDGVHMVQDNAAGQEGHCTLYFDSPREVSGFMIGGMDMYAADFLAGLPWQWHCIWMRAVARQSLPRSIKNGDQAGLDTARALLRQEEGMSFEDSRLLDAILAQLPDVHYRWEDLPDIDSAEALLSRWAFYVDGDSDICCDKVKVVLEGRMAVRPRSGSAASLATHVPEWRAGAAEADDSDESFTT